MENAFSINAQLDVKVSKSQEVLMVVPWVEEEVGPSQDVWDAWVDEEVHEFQDVVLVGGSDCRVVDAAASLLLCALLAAYGVHHRLNQVFY
ncbi:hypothetical protein TTRE_0000624901 [Trichuris trichiura]|uniref:Uncharacterized protein n=1 Tax=Trichuris trichiura TaxID=36087 RepID=A0A077ZDN6_TRITR|nr:hypothetical protein TTRE_0000624901 [Trichuris trichiura]